MSKSCVGCAFLYTEDQGYSNYTVEDTDVCCAADANPNLPASEPLDWNMKADADNWPATNQSRCQRYEEGEMLRLDVEADDDEIAERDALIARAFQRQGNGTP
jgi:hypothetical protein